MYQNRNYSCTGYMICCMYTVLHFPPDLVEVLSAPWLPGHGPGYHHRLHVRVKVEVLQVGGVLGIQGHVVVGWDSILYS